MSDSRDILLTVFIESTPEKIWDALTSAEHTAKYLFGRRVESEWKHGSTVKYWMPDGRLDTQGEILELEFPNRLSFTWHVEWMEEMRSLPPTRVTFVIEASGPVSALTVRHDAYNGVMIEKYYEQGRRGWSMILSGLKTLLETGRPLAVETPAAD